MKISKTLLFALLIAALSSLAFGQSGSVTFNYPNYPGNDSLGYPCTGPRTPFEDGYSIYIFWDQDGNGPSENDPQPPVGPGPSGVDSCNFNHAVFNGVDYGFAPGFFGFPDYFTVWELGTSPRYYLRISKPNPGGVCWTSTVYTMTPGPYDWIMTDADWTCSDSPCFTVNPPAAPTNFHASLDAYCLYVKFGWTPTGTNVDGFHIYYGDDQLVASPGAGDTTVTVLVTSDQRRSYYIRAYNAGGNSDSSSHAWGSTYMVRFVDDTTTNIHGDSLHGTDFTVHFRSPQQVDTLSPILFVKQLWLLRDSTSDHHGGYTRFAELCSDSAADSMTCTFPNNDAINYCRLLLVDSAYNANSATFTDTTDTVFHLGSPTAAGGRKMAVPDHFDLAQNYPNPFNPTTEIEFSVPVQSQIRIRVYNIMGQCVRTLVQGSYPAGIHHIQWDGRNDGGVNVGTGLYIYRMEAPHYTQVKKMLLMK